MKIPITTAEMKEQLKQNARDPNTKRNYPELDSKKYMENNMEYDLGPNACEADYFYEEEAREHRRKLGIKESCQWCDDMPCSNQINCPYSDNLEEE
jgi:hypothetical protein